MRLLSHFGFFLVDVIETHIMNVFLFNKLHKIVCFIMLRAKRKSYVSLKSTSSSVRSWVKVVEACRIYAHIHFVYIYRKNYGFRGKLVSRLTHKFGDFEKLNNKNNNLMFVINLLICKTGFAYPRAKRIIIHLTKRNEQ